MQGFVIELGKILCCAYIYGVWSDQCSIFQFLADICQSLNLYIQESIKNVNVFKIVACVFSKGCQNQTMIFAQNAVEDAKIYFYFMEIYPLNLSRVISLIEYLDRPSWK